MKQAAYLPATDVAHVADPEGLPGDRTQRPGDRDSSQAQLAPELRIVDSLGVAHHGDRVGPTIGGRERLAVDSGQSGPDRGGDSPVPREALLQAFLEHEPRRLAQGQQLVHGGGREVEAGILHDRLPAQQVGVVGGHGRPRSALGHGAVGDDQDRHSGRCAEGLLRAGQQHVQAPFVEALLHARRRTDTVDDDQLVATGEQRAVVLERRSRPGRGVHVGHGHRGVAARGEIPFELFGAYGEPPLGSQHVEIQRQSLGQLDVTVTEVAVGDDEQSLARREQVDQRHLHGQRARTRDDKGLGGFGPDDLPQLGQTAPKRLDERGRHVGHRGPGKFGQDALVDGSRPGNHC